MQETVARVPVDIAVCQLVAPNSCLSLHRLHTMSFPAMGSTGLTLQPRRSPWPAAQLLVAGSRQGIDPHPCLELIPDVAEHREGHSQVLEAERAIEGRLVTLAIASFHLRKPCMRNLRICVKE